ncbi:MAG: glutamyl-tRNA reductase [Acidobacteriia bacterium]|nr:glutamyl-tRNA reductase [Terriglobia bacterium]MBV8905373.1 glutamyl-tRNA reductase [Terriglobia bacterium]MBV9745839.1 glutamyl-tRNA reductase [Terriglobia bacterium]
MKLHLSGVSHKTAPVEVRERLAFRPEALPAALQSLKSYAGVAEAMILSTCNRVEITVTTEDDAEPQAIVDSFLAQSHADGAFSGMTPYLYRHEGRDAIHHLFRVAASLDSMIVGEPQILGQLKASYSIAKDAGAVCGWLDGLLTRAFGIAKRVRSETGIGQMAVSVSYAAVELARKIFGSLENRTVMIAGAGKMSELTARHLRRSSAGKSHVFVTNRTYERAVEMARLFHGTPVEYTRFTATLPEVDILIASSAAPHYILHKDDMRRIMAARRNRPMLLIDISVPRNIEPAVNDIEQVFLKDIDALQEVVDSNLRERQKEAHRAEALVAEEVDRMMARLRVAEVTPTIVALQSVLEQIGASELEKVRRKYGPLDARQEEALTALTRGIVNKIAHGPITELRSQATQANGAHVVAVVKKVFHLED